MKISEREQKLLILAAVATGILYALAFNYPDGQAYTIWTVDFLDCLLEGRISDFYAQTAANRYDLEMERSFSQFWYLAPASLWNLPLWIAEKFFSVDLMHPLALFWGKLWFLLLQIGVSIQVYRSSPRYKLFAAFLTMSSIFSFISAGYTGQNEFYWIFFSLLSIMAYRDGRYNVFCGISLYTALVKPFWIFAFVPLFLLRDKRIHRLLLWFIAYIGAQVIHMLFMADLKLHGLANPSGAMTLRRILTTITLPTPFGDASILLLILMAVYVWAYIYDPDLQKPTTDSVLFPYAVVSVVFLLLLFLSEHDFYRYVIVIPYIAILLVAKKEPFWTIIAATVTETYLAWILIAKGTYLFQPIFMEGSALGLPPIDLRGRRFWAPWAFFRVFYDSEVLRAGIISLLIAALIITIFLYLDRLKFPAPPKFIYRMFLWFRALIVPVFFLLLTLITYFIPAPI